MKSFKSSLYQFLWILSLIMFHSTSVTAAEEVVGPPVSLVRQLGIGDSATVSLSCTQGPVTSGSNNQVIFVLKQNARLMLYCKSFSYDPGIGGKPLADKEYSLLLNLAPQVTSVEDKERYPSCNISFSFTKKGKDITCMGEKAIDLPAGTYIISYHGFLGFKQEYVPVSFQQTSRTSVSKPSMSYVKMAYAVKEIVEDTTSFTPPYDNVPHADTTPCSSLGNGEDENYVVTLINRTRDAVDGSKTVTYYDGFGNPTETVSCEASPTLKNWVVPIEYDSFGLLSKEWLPGVTERDATGKFVNIDKAKTASMETNNDSAPFSQYEYEDSPLSRQTGMYKPGKAWHRSTVKVSTRYITNRTDRADMKVWRLSVADNGKQTPIIKVGGMYKAGTLRGTIQTDEDGNSSLEFRDRQGKLVLSRRFNDSGGRLDTYYIYDDYGLLRAVLPPKASIMVSLGTVLTERVEKYAYLYRYDERDRMTGKKLPGIAWKTMEYDDFDRMVSEQDGRQRSLGEKTVHLYDVHGRECLQGIASANADVSNTTITYTGQDGQTKGYSCPTKLASDIKRVLQTYYYDNYDFMSMTSLPKAELSLSEKNIQQGRLTGSMALRLYGNGQADKYDAQAVSYYRNGLVKCALTQNHLGDHNAERYTYNFVGHPLTKLVTYSTKTAEGGIRLSYKYSYDLQGRLRKETMSTMNGKGEMTLVDRKYDELGRVSTDARNGDPALLTHYTYNVRSQITGLSCPLFTETLAYEKNPYGGRGCYNGNIVAKTWRSMGKEEGYSFKYDRLSQLTEAQYFLGTDKSNKYTTSYSYDDMGNILSMQRNRKLDNGEWGLADDMTYSYDGNKLVKLDNTCAPTSYSQNFFLSDNVDEDCEYDYDENGNMTMNLNQGIDSISYNDIGKPSQIQMIDGGKVEYVYSASGEKLQVTHTFPLTGEREVTDYCGDLVYTNKQLESVRFDGGYMLQMENKKIPFFYVKDYQGNNRVVYNDNGFENQWIDYYPFGGISYSNVHHEQQRFFYNDKELDQLLGLFWYDYGARMYDGIRFTTMDSMAEHYYSISPYAYCANNPINAIDSYGNSIYMLFYSIGYSRIGIDGDEEFKAAAYTRKYDIEHSMGFNSNTDIVLMLPFTDTTMIPQIVKKNIDTYSDKYGMTKEVGFWSHAGFDGPIGSVSSYGSEEAIGSRQMSLTGWGKIDFNWEPNASIGFYGCNTGTWSEKENDRRNFANGISSNRNMKNINVYGQPKKTYFSSSQREASLTSNKKRLLDKKEGYSFPRTYLISTKRNRLLWWLDPTIERMKLYKNGKELR